MNKTLPIFIKEPVKVPLFVKSPEEETDNVFSNPDYQRYCSFPAHLRPPENIYIKSELSLPDVSKYLKYAKPAVGGVCPSYSPTIRRGNLIHFMCVDEKGSLISEYKGIYHGSCQMHLLGRSKKNIISTNAGMLKNDIVKYIRFGVFVFRVIDSSKL